MDMKIDDMVVCLCHNQNYAKDVNMIKYMNILQHIMS